MGLRGRKHKGVVVQSGAPWWGMSPNLEIKYASKECCVVSGTVIETEVFWMTEEGTIVRFGCGSRNRKRSSQARILKPGLLHQLRYLGYKVKCQFFF